MVVNWNAQNDQKLLLAILKTIDKPIPYTAIATELVNMGFEKGLTGKAVSRHIDKLKTDIAAGKIPSDTGGSHAKNISSVIEEAEKLTRSAKKAAGMPTTPEKKKGRASAASTPANTDKKRKRVLDDIGFREVAEDTPMHDESPAKRMLSKPAPTLAVAEDVYNTLVPRQPGSPVATEADLPVFQTEADGHVDFDDTYDYFGLLNSYYNQ